MSCVRKRDHKAVGIYVKYGSNVGHRPFESRTMPPAMSAAIVAMIEDARRLSLALLHATNFPFWKLSSRLMCDKKTRRLFCRRLFRLRVGSKHAASQAEPSGRAMSTSTDAFYMPYTSDREAAQRARAATASRLRRHTAGTSTPRDARAASLASLRASPSTVYMTSTEEWGSRGLRNSPPWAPPWPRSVQELRMHALCPDLSGASDDPNTSHVVLGQQDARNMTRSRASILSASTHDISRAGFGKPSVRRSASSLTGWRSGFSSFEDFTYSNARRSRSNLRPSTARSDYELRPWGAGFLQTTGTGAESLEAAFGGPRLTWEVRKHRGSAC